MDNTIKRTRTVNLDRLEQLTDQQLLERIQQGPAKLKSKEDKYANAIREIQDRLKNYQEYRKGDMEACKKILADRKNPKPLAKAA